MTYLTTVQILFLHSRLIAETGGSAGVRDVALLESAAARPQATYGGADLYPDIFAKAAALMQSLVNNHPFVDGNKRVGIAATALFLQRNGHRLVASNQEVEEFTLAVARGERSFDEIANWLAAQTIPH